MMPTLFTRYISSSPLYSLALLAPAAAARSLHPHARAPRQAHAAFAGKLFHASVCVDGRGLSFRAICSAVESVRSARATVGKQRHLRVSQQLDFADDPISTFIFARAAGAAADGILSHTDGVCMLQRFGRSIERIGHVGVHGGDAVLRRTRAHATGDGLVETERFP